MEPEERTVNIKLMGQEKTVVIWRYSKHHCWMLKNAVILCRFRTGTKLHQVISAIVGERDGKFYIASMQRAYGYQGYCSPVTWSDMTVGGPMMVPEDVIAKQGGRKWTN